MKNVHRVGLGLALMVCSALPAFAQVDLSGMWQTLPRNQDGSGMTGDTAGVPVSENGRWRGDSWSPEDFDVAEWVCRPHTFHYGLEGGLSRMRVWVGRRDAPGAVTMVAPACRNDAGGRPLRFVSAAGGA